MSNIIYKRTGNNKKIQEYRLKRPLDILLSTIGLILSSPLWLFISIAIKLEDGGPIFFTQERWGRYGSKIVVKKFRSMIPNTSNKQAKLCDPRITNVGNFLRATGMDELPQLLSIWRGDMSFVGPRALAINEEFNEKIEDDVRYEDIHGFKERLNVRPGLTSISTLYYRKDIHPERKFKYDLIYISKQSLWLDIKLILMSLWVSIRGNWEKRDDKL